MFSSISYLFICFLGLNGNHVFAQDGDFCEDHSEALNQCYESLDENSEMATTDLCSRYPDHLHLFSQCALLVCSARCSEWTSMLSSFYESVENDVNEKRKKANLEECDLQFPGCSFLETFKTHSPTKQPIDKNSNDTKRSDESAGEEGEDYSFAPTFEGEYYYDPYHNGAGTSESKTEVLTATPAPSSKGTSSERAKDQDDNQELTSAVGFHQERRLILVTFMTLCFSLFSLFSD